jgi:uncharacterized membrane protein
VLGDHQDITIWALARWLHLLAAIVWIGGQIFILAVVLPILRVSLPPTERTLLVAQVGRRFWNLSGIALATLIVTGFINAERRHVVWSRLTEYPYGRTLHLKLTLVGIVVVVSLVHTLYFGRRLEALAERARALDSADPALERQRRRLQIWSGTLSALNLLLNVVIVLLAATLIA